METPYCLRNVSFIYLSTKSESKRDLVSLNLPVTHVYRQSVSKFVTDTLYARAPHFLILDTTGEYI